MSAATSAMSARLAFTPAQASARRVARVERRRRVISHAIPAAGAPNSFLQVSDEQSFFQALHSEIDAGRISKELLPLWEDFFSNYKNAILSAELPTHDMKLVSEVQAAIADTVINQMANPYTFPSYHEAITEPYDYFEFGQKYVGSLIDFTKSWVGHRDRFDRIQQQLAAGENVILLANHQSEADPGIWAHMLTHTHPELARKIIYVAGDRVVTDPLCVPFSLGRNLFCVHSKRHLDDDPATKDQKSATNRQTLRNMGLSMARGGTLLWIAPAGGRDRAGDDGVYVPAQFDSGSVELMRAVSTKVKKKAGKTSHLYPFAMYSAPLMPPPKTVEKGVGERRMVNFTGVGISVGEPVDVEAITSGITEKEQLAKTLSDAVYADVCALYKELDAAVKDPSTAPAHFTQPWMSEQGMTGAAMSVAALDGSASKKAEAAVSAGEGLGQKLKKQIDKVLKLGAAVGQR